MKLVLKNGYCSIKIKQKGNGADYETCTEK